MAERLECDQRQSRRRRVALSIRLPCFSVIGALAGIEAPRAVRILNRAQPGLVHNKLFANTLMQFLRLIGAQERIFRETGWRWFFRLTARRIFLRRRRRLGFRRQLRMNLTRAPVLGWIILREESLEEFYAMRHVVAVARLDGQHVLRFLFEGGEVSWMAGAVPGRAQDLSGVIVDHRLADVRSGAGGVDAARVRRLQDVVGDANRLHRMELARWKDALGCAYVMTRDARAGRPVADIQWSQACVVGRVLQIIGRAQRFVHNVDQMSVILDIFDAITVFDRHGRAPDARLRVAAHAVSAHEIAGVTDAPFDARSTWSVSQPRIHLADMIIHRLADGHPRIGIRRRFEQPQFDFVSGRIGLGAQEVDAARLEQAIDRCAVRFVLLVDSFVLIAPFSVFNQRQQGLCQPAGRLRLRGVHSNLRGQCVIGNRQVRRQQAWFFPLEDDLKPVIARLPDPAVVEIFDIVGSARDQDALNALAFRYLDHLSLFGRIVRLMFDARSRRQSRLQVDRFDRYTQRDALPLRPRSVVREGHSLWSDPRFAPARAFEDRRLICDRRYLQRIIAGDGNAIDQIDISVERVQDFSPSGRWGGVDAESVRLAGIGRLRNVTGFFVQQRPFHADAAIPGERRRTRQTDRDLECFSGLQLQAFLPLSGKLKLHLRRDRIPGGSGSLFDCLAVDHQHEPR